VFQVVQALQRYDGHLGVVEDVAWHNMNPDIFASVGDDKNLMLWDLRDKKPIGQTVAHTAEVNCVQFNPSEQYLLATGSADRTVVLHDTRFLPQCVHCMQAHKEEVFQVSNMPLCAFCSIAAQALGTSAP
jgi:histone-binding protein RBBP4